MKEYWTNKELLEHWTLSAEDKSSLRNKKEAIRLGFAVLLKFFQYEGRFPLSRKEVPASIVHFLAAQVEAAPEAYVHYAWQGRTIEYHRAQIREVLGFRESSISDGEQMQKWLVTHVFPQYHQEEQIREQVRQWFKRMHLEMPTPDRLTRQIRSAARTFEQCLYATTMARLPQESQASLDALLNTTEQEKAEENEKQEITLQDLRMEPGRVELATLPYEIAKLRRIRELHLPADLFAGISYNVLTVYCDRASVEEPSRLRSHVAPQRFTLLAALCILRSQKITDGLVDLLLLVVNSIYAYAKECVEQEYMSRFDQEIEEDSIFYDIATVALERPDQSVREVVFSVASEPLLRNMIEKHNVKHLVSSHMIHKALFTSYTRYYRNTLLEIVNILEFCPHTALHEPVIQAIRLIKDYTHSFHSFYPCDLVIPIKDVVPVEWRKFVIGKDDDETKRVKRLDYEIYTLKVLCEKVRTKEIWVMGAHRFRSPAEDLPIDFEQKRETYYAALHQPLEIGQFIGKIKTAMQAALCSLDASLPRISTKVRILPHRKHPIVLTPLEIQPESSNVIKLKREIARRWPNTNLLDILRETALRTHCLDHLTSVASRERFSREVLQHRLLLCLYGLGTNIGIKRLSNTETTYADLCYILSRYMHKEQLRHAIAHVANAIFASRKAEIWGEETRACASAFSKLGSWQKSPHTQRSNKMIYWHVEEKSTCIYSQLKSCSSSEIAFMLEGVLRHNASADIQKIYIDIHGEDTHGENEIAFAFCYLLGIRLLPRLKDVASQKLFLPETTSSSYEHIQSIITRPIQWALIENQYDEMIKYAAALKAGTTETGTILQRFASNNSQHPLYQAFVELGRAAKTVFLCQYLESEKLRREIHEGLLVLENWNEATDFIFYGSGEEFTSHCPYDPEISMLALHLLQTSIVYINTLMVQEVLAERKWLKEFTKEDYRAMAPLFYNHINPYGILQLDMEERLRLDEKAS